MVRRVIRKPFDIQAVAKALVETAAQIAAEKRIDVKLLDENAKNEPKPEGLPPPGEKH